LSTIQEKIEIIVVIHYFGSRQIKIKQSESSSLINWSMDIEQMMEKINDLIS